MRKIIVLLILISIMVAGCAGVKSSLDGKSTQSIDEDIEKIEKALEKGTQEEAVETSTNTKTGTAVGGEESTSDEETTSVEEQSNEGYYKVLEVNETQLVKLNVNVDDESEVNVTYSKPLDEKGEWQTNYGDAGKYEIEVTINDGEFEVEKKVLLVVKKVNRPPKVVDITLE